MSLVSRPSDDSAKSVKLLDARIGSGGPNEGEGPSGFFWDGTLGHRASTIVFLITLGFLFPFLLPAAGVTQEVVESQMERAEAPPLVPTPTPLELLADLEGFWSTGEADSIIARLCPDEIRLSFRRIGPRDGSFDQTQAKYLLADLFEFARTDSFFIIEYEYDPSGDDPPKAVGHWYYRGAGRIEREARVDIKLTRHAGSWTISSIEAKKW
jgi:hypothetical protein